MKVNEDKTQYMVFSRSETEMATRLTMNSKTIDRVEEIKLIGVWVKKAYTRMTMLTKLKYVGVKEEDLLNIYVLYIRSLLEYSLAFNTLKSSLDQSIWGMKRPSVGLGWTT